MRPTIVAANWKMNGSQQIVEKLLTDIRSLLKKKSAQIAVFPPFVYLEQVSKLLKNTDISWGAQNVSSESQGAFTGEISADMLADLHCRYVLVGHSERRTLFGEDNAIIAKKFVQAQKANLIPIVCVGESLEQRKKNETESVIEKQLAEIFKQASKEFVIAYEPVWAIGTGLAATPEQAQEVHYFIRDRLKKFFGSTADNMLILYGGSVKSNNASSLFAMPDIDGGLIGGASLNAEEFVKICESIRG